MHSTISRAVTLLFRSVPVLAGLAAFALTVPQAQAAFVITFTQVGNDIVAIGSGSLDTQGLVQESVDSLGPGLTPANAYAVLGASGTNNGEELAMNIAGYSGPSNYGPGSGFEGSSGSGSIAGISIDQSHPVQDIPTIIVPVGYVSGTELSDTATWVNQTFSSRGLTPGEYVWTWGTGASADSLTIIVGVPESASILLLLPGLISLGVASSRRRMMAGF